MTKGQGLGRNYGAFRSRQVSVSAAGTAEKAIDSETLIRTVVVRANIDNDGKVFIGNDGNNDVSSSDGYILSQGESVTISADRLRPEESDEYKFNLIDLQTLYVDSEENGDIVSLLYYI